MHWSDGLLSMLSYDLICILSGQSQVKVPGWMVLIQNGQFCPFCNFSNIFLPKWSKLTDSEWPILTVLQLFQYFLTIVVGMDLEWPILAVLQLLQYFPTKVVQIDSEWLILAVLQLFQYFRTEVVQIDSKWPIVAVLQLFQYFPTKVVQIDSEWPILAIFQLFQYFPTKRFGMANFGCFATFPIFSY